MYDDRRNGPRFKHAIDVTYLMEDGTVFRVAKIKNISRQGATLQIDHPLNPKELLKLSLPDSEATIEAEVVWCQVTPEFIGAETEEEEVRYSCGIKYKDVITEKVNEILNEILKEIESRK